jgi:hypothetical protein
VQIHPFKAVKIQYRSYGNMKLITETLRCNESFHKRPKFDNCLIKQSDGTYAFARLLCIFKCRAAGKEWHLARVRLFQTVAEEKKSPTGLRRVREERYGFIELSWIVRSIFLSSTFDRAGEFFICNLVDSEESPSDVYLRLRELSDKSWY